ncbi:SIR2 family protein [Roseomonas aeriglobus]|nr:SIR2 family protein [Roseomonas aeriglobus]
MENGELSKPCVRNLKLEREDYVVLLGAGASVEAGLLTSANLTQAIYNSFNERQRLDRFALLLAYVISKLQVRNAKRGTSPYAPIEVEELFDALNLLYRRDSILISEFVERWDSAIDSYYTRFDGSEIRSNFNNILNKTLARANRRSAFDAGTADFERLAASLQPRSFFTNDARHIPDPLQPFFVSLIKFLQVDQSRLDYLYPLVRDKRASLIATLNYDLSIEKACELNGLKYDYGLDRWAQQKRVDWRQRSDDKRLLKMHGSINWTGSFEDPKIRYDEIKPYEKRIMIFGGVDNKLSADGPFLQFLYRLERTILRTNALLVVGYSFRDAHINALINRWRLTRRNSKLAVIDPSPPPLWQLGFADGPIKRQVGERETTHTASVRIIQSPAGEGIQRFINEPDLFDRPPTVTH